MFPGDNMFPAAIFPGDVIRGKTEMRTIMTCSGCSQTMSTCDWSCGPTFSYCSTGDVSNTMMTCSSGILGSCGGGTSMTCSSGSFGICGGGTSMTCSSGSYGICGGTLMTCSSMFGCNNPKPSETKKTCGFSFYGCNGGGGTDSTCGWFCSSPTSGLAYCPIDHQWTYDMTASPAF